jgi:hypothetical protein
MKLLDAGATLRTGASVNEFSFPRGSTAALLPLRNMTFVISGKLDKTKVGKQYTVCMARAVFRIRICMICMFLAHPDLLVRGTNPDPGRSIIKRK